MITKATSNDDEVICPNCCTQFRAIPINVQHILLDLGVDPPFTTVPMQQSSIAEMTPLKAAFFMKRFKSDEKMLGPNEQAAIDFVLAMLADTRL